MQKLIEYIKKNWLVLGFGILILWIVINDVLEQFVWKTGMAFRPNSMYVYLIYVVIFVVAPIAIIERVFKDRYKEIELEEYKDKCDSPKDVGRIIFSGVGKFVLIIGLVFALFWLVGMFQSKLLETVIDTSQPYIFISDFSQLPFVAGERARLPFKVKCGIAGCAVIVFLLSICATIGSYHCVTENGVLHKFLWMEKQYAWEDIKEVSSRTIERGAKVIVLEMSDGHKVVMDEISVEHNSEELEKFISLE